MSNLLSHVSCLYLYCLFNFIDTDCPLSNDFERVPSGRLSQLHPQPSEPAPEQLVEPLELLAPETKTNSIL